MSFELVEIAEGQMCGERLQWSKGTGEIKPIPAGKYFRNGPVLMVADGEDGEDLTPSAKVAYRLTDTEKPTSSFTAQPPLRYAVSIEYSPSSAKPWRTIVTVGEVVAKPQAQPVYRQCVLSGKYSLEEAQRVWETEPSRFASVSSKSVGNLPVIRGFPKERGKASVAQVRSRR